MDARRARHRWDELAGLVAARVERDDPELDLAMLLSRLEGEVGVPVLAGPDPSPSVSARRFARVYAAALRGGRLPSGSVLRLVERAIAALAADASAPQPWPTQPWPTVAANGRTAAAGSALSGPDPPPDPPQVGSRPRAGSRRR